MLVLALAAGAALTRPLRAADEPPPPPLFPVLDDPTLWRTHAHGDEVLVLALDPKVPNRLWAGSEDGGVVVWDLSRLTYEQHVAPQQEGLPSNRIYDIAFDPVRGDAWIATDRGVSHVRDGVWRAWTDGEGFPGKSARAIAVADDGTVWVGTASQGVASLPRGADEWTHHPPEPYDERTYGPYEGPGAPSVIDLAIDHEGKVWAAHGRGARAGLIAISVNYPSDGNWRHIHSVGPGGNPKRGPPTDQILTLAVDADGELWAGTWARGAVQYDGTDWKRHTTSRKLCGRSVLAIATTENGVWAACGDEKEGEGLAFWSGGPEWTPWPNVITPQRITALAVTGDAGTETVWLGTDGPNTASLGIIPFDVLDEFVTPPLRTAGATPHSNDVTGLLVDELGRLWVGTRGDGLLSYDGTKWEQHTEASSEGGLPGNTVTDIAEVDGTIWVSTTKSRYADGLWRDGGIGVFDPRSERWVRSFRPEPGGLPDGDVGSLAIDSEGRVLIGLGVASGGPGALGTTHHGEGFFVFDPVEDVWSRHTHDSTGAALVGDTVLDIAVDKNGPTWIATSFHHDPFLLARAGGGVSRFSESVWRGWAGGDDGLITFHGNGDGGGGRDPWITGDVRAIHVDEDGRPWAGAWDVDAEKLLELWPAVDAVVNTFIDGLWRTWSFPGEGWVSAVESDRWGRVWVSTTRGHATTEHNATEIGDLGPSPGGLHVHAGDDVDTPFVGIESLPGAVSAIAHDPVAGTTWFGAENGGLARLLAPSPTPSATPTASVTPTPSTTPTASATPDVSVLSTETPVSSPTPEPTEDATRDGRHAFLPLVISRH